MIFLSRLSHLVVIKMWLFKFPFFPEHLKVIFSIKKPSCTAVSPFHTFFKRWSTALLHPNRVNRCKHHIEMDHFSSQSSDITFEKDSKMFASSKIREVVRPLSPLRMRKVELVQLPILLLWGQTNAPQKKRLCTRKKSKHCFGISTVQYV